MLLESYLDAIVSRFGLKAESSLEVGVDGPAGGLILALVCQSDLVATLLLHAFGQVADGDLTTNTEPVWEQNKNIIKLVINVERKRKSPFNFNLYYVKYISLGVSRATRERCISVC